MGMSYGGVQHPKRLYKVSQDGLASQEHIKENQNAWCNTFVSNKARETRTEDGSENSERKKLQDTRANEVAANLRDDDKD